MNAAARSWGACDGLESRSAKIIWGGIQLSDQRRGLLSGISNTPNTELAVIELVKAVIKLQDIVDKMAGELQPQADISPTPKHKYSEELAQVREDILKSLNAATGKPYGG